jgi:hypothetical protein
VRPDRNVPLPLLDHVRVGLLDQRAEPCEHLAPPVAQLLIRSSISRACRLVVLRRALPSFSLLRLTFGITGLRNKVESQLTG